MPCVNEAFPLADVLSISFGRRWWGRSFRYYAWRSRLWHQSCGRLRNVDVFSLLLLRTSFRCNRETFPELCRHAVFLFVDACTTSAKQSLSKQQDLVSGTRRFDQSPNPFRSFFAATLSHCPHRFHCWESTTWSCAMLQLNLKRKWLHDKNNEFKYCFAASCPASSCPPGGRLENARLEYSCPASSCPPVGQTRWCQTRIPRTEISLNISCLHSCLPQFAKFPIPQVLNL